MARIWLINQYSSTPATGMGGRHHYLARELAKRGHQVTLIAASWHHLLREPDGRINLPKTEQVDGYTFYRISVPRYKSAHSKKRIWNWFAFAYKVSKLYRTLLKKPDVILQSSPSLIAYLGAERLARRLGARLVFEVRDIWPKTLIEGTGVSPSHPFIRFMQLVEDRAYRNADALVSNLEGCIEHMVSRGAERNKFTWVSNGVSLGETTARKPLSPEVVAMIPSDGLRIAYTGTLGHLNMLDNLIEAVALVREARLIIVGQGPSKSTLECKAAKLGLENVVFTGPIPKDQIQSLLADVDACFIGLPPHSLFRYGVSPNKLFDYMLAAKPVLYAIDSGDYGPIGAFSAGFCIPPNDTEALVQAIVKLRDMPVEEREQMGVNGRKVVREFYDYAKLAVKLERVLLP